MSERKVARRKGASPKEEQLARSMGKFHTALKPLWRRNWEKQLSWWAICPGLKEVPHWRTDKTFLWYPPGVFTCGYGNKKKEVICPRSVNLYRLSIKSGFWKGRGHFRSIVWLDGKIPPALKKHAKISRRGSQPFHEEKPRADAIVNFWNN